MTAAACSCWPAAVRPELTAPHKGLVHARALAPQVDDVAYCPRLKYLLLRLSGAETEDRSRALLEAITPDHPSLLVHASALHVLGLVVTCAGGGECTECWFHEEQGLASSASPAAHWDCGLIPPCSTPSRPALQGLTISTPASSVHG